jgi:hypothetical protein
MELENAKNIVQALQESIETRKNRHESLIEAEISTYQSSGATMYRNKTSDKIETPRSNPNVVPTRSISDSNLADEQQDIIPPPAPTKPKPNL